MLLSSAIMEKILAPLNRAWGATPLLRKVKDSFVLLKPGVYQSLMKASLFPILTVQRMAHERLSPLLNPATPLPPANRALRFYLLELVSIIERLGAFAYTGNARVLPSALGNQLWFGLAVQGGHLPFFNPAVVELSQAGDLGLHINTASWPTDVRGRSPLTSSERAMELTYGTIFAKVRFLLQSFSRFSRRAPMRVLPVLRSSQCSMSCTFPNASSSAIFAMLHEVR